MNKKIKLQQLFNGFNYNNYSMDLEVYQDIVFIIDMEQSHNKYDVECIFCNDGNNLLNETHLIGKSCKCKYLFHAACIDQWFKTGKQECIMCHAFVHRPKKQNKPDVLKFDQTVQDDELLIDHLEEYALRPTDHVYIYSFALCPEEHQPSGTYSYSRPGETKLVLNLSNHQTKQMKKLEKQSKKHMYNKQQKYVKGKKF